MKNASLLFLFLALTCWSSAAFADDFTAAGEAAGVAGPAAAPSASEGGGMPAASAWGAQAGSRPGQGTYGLPAAQGYAPGQGTYGLPAAQGYAPGQGNAGMPSTIMGAMPQGNAGMAAITAGGEAGAKARAELIKAQAAAEEKAAQEKAASEKGAAEKGEAPGAAPVKAPAEMSSTERFMTEDLAASEKARPQPFKLGRLTQFGYDFFRSEGAFAPVTDVPVGPDYIVGPGDRLILTLWGSIDGTYELEINRAGEIVLPRVGAVKVAGEKYGELPGVLKSHLARVFKDFHLNLNMGKLRLVKVYVVGEVAAPGDYNVTSLSTVINALSAAGGPTKKGSLRSIQLRRGGAVIETVDLYDFFLKGDKSRDIRLQAGDTIFVPVIGKVAGIAGNVRRPAIYELKGETSLKDLLALAEGINPTGYLQRVQISRVEEHEKKVVTDFNVDPKLSGKSMETMTAGVSIKDMDVVRIFPIDATLRDYVHLDGLVLRPGDYALKPGMHLSTLLTEGGLLPEYYAQAEITRLYPPDYHPEVTYVDIDKALAKDPLNDVPLMEFDRVQLFSRWQMEEMPKVRIGGQVQRPGEYRLFDKMTVRDLIMQAGNTTLTAYLKNAEITRIKKTGNSVTAYPIIINLQEALKGNPKDNIALVPFDELTIRRIPNWAEETERYVTLKGEFVFPGVYPIYKGEKLSAVIERAGGFTDKAYLQGAKFTRVSVRELQQKRMDEAIAKAEDEILQKQADLAALSSSKEELEANRAALEDLKRQVALLKTKKAEGRLIVGIGSLEQLKGSRFDLELMGGDTLEVSRDPQAVNVIGQVYNPSSMVYGPNEDVGTYLDKVGGPTKDADEDSMYLVKIDGSVISKHQNSGFFFNRFASKKVDSGDTIVVPQEYEKTAWMRNVKDIATILGQVALAAGVMLAAGL